MFGDDEHQADAHVEDVVHFGLVDLAQACQPREDRWNGPRAAIEADGASLGENARGVIDQAAPRDMGDAVNDPFDPVVAMAVLTART